MEDLGELIGHTDHPKASSFSLRYFGNPLDIPYLSLHHCNHVQAYVSSLFGSPLVRTEQSTAQSPPIPNPYSSPNHPAKIELFLPPPNPQQS